MSHTILIVDDDPTQRRLLESVIAGQGYKTITAEDGLSALDMVRAAKPSDISVVLLDLVMPGMNGIAVLGELRPIRPDLPVLVLTANGSVAAVVQAMQAGARDFIVKPASPERLHVSIQNALSMTKLTGEVKRLTRRAESRLQFSDLIAHSLVMRQSIMLAERGAQSTIPILIDGESGVGKEVIARAIQGASGRAGKLFVAVNCGAIPENLVESILFGHEKGSFTGAVTKKIGKFQEADGGTLFLDEVGELPLNMQVKLLRAIQEGEIDPVGAVKPVNVDIRLISATNRDLSKLVAEGAFREDLFYRLNVFPLNLPPLRDRREDIPELIAHFIDKFAAEENKSVRGIEASARRALVDYEWPGNVRQLENVVYRAVVLCDRDMLTLHDFPQVAGISPEMMNADSEFSAEAAAAGENPALTDAHGHLRPLSDVEAEMIEMAIEKYGGRMSEIARRLGIGRSTLYRKVRELGLEARASA